MKNNKNAASNAKRAVAAGLLAAQLLSGAGCAKQNSTPSKRAQAQCPITTSHVHIYERETAQGTKMTALFDGEYLTTNGYNRTDEYKELDLDENEKKRKIPSINKFQHGRCQRKLGNTISNNV